MSMEIGFMNFSVLVLILLLAGSPVNSVDWNSLNTTVTDQIVWRLGESLALSV